MNASAGSGKTFRLAYEYIRNVVEEPELYRHILAVTFTNKATEEMKSRILLRLHELAAGEKSPYIEDLTKELGLDEAAIRDRARRARSRILHDYSRFAVLTIDKFFQRIIRAFIKELNIDLNFNLEIRTDTILSKAADALMERIATDRELKEWIFGFVEERMEENKNWRIKEELVGLGQEIFRDEYKRVLAAAPSKRRLGEVVRKAAARCEQLRSSLVATARKGLDAMAAAGLGVDDFAQKAKGPAGYFARLADGRLEAPNSYVRRALDDDSGWYGKNSPRRGAVESAIPALRPLLRELCDSYAASIRFINSTSLLRRNFRSFALLADLYDNVARQCREERIMPIAETNDVLRRLIAGSDTPFIFEKAGNYYSHFMIDEFQDTSAAQWENFLPLLRNALAQSGGSPVLLVGDIKQSIYRWRGGDWRILAREVKAGFDDTALIPLSTNYRSRRRVVEFNNEAVSRIVSADEAETVARLDRAAESGAISRGEREELRRMYLDAYGKADDDGSVEPLGGIRQQSGDLSDSGYVNVTEYESGGADDTEEKPMLIRRIEEIESRGYGAGDIAVLVRSNSEGSRCADMLLSYKNAHPESPYRYDVVSSDSLIIGSAPVCKFVIACMRCATDSLDTISRAVINRRLGRDCDMPFEDGEAGFFRDLRLLPPQEAFENIVMEFGLGDDSSEVAYIQALHEQIIGFGNSSIADLPLFLEWWDEHGSSQPLDISQKLDALTIATIHKSKGLQYKVVIIPSCRWALDPKAGTVIWSDCSILPPGDAGIMPLSSCKEMGESLFAQQYLRETVLSHIDNLNILYVAVTRAEEELHILLPYTLTRQGTRRTEGIGRLMSEAVAGMDGRTAESGGTRTTEFGTPQARDSRREECIENLEHYHTRRPQLEPRLRLPSQRYMDEAGATAEISPRNRGILLHKLFAGAISREDVLRAIEAQRIDGLITAAEADELSRRMDEAMSDPLVGEWFDAARWEAVRNENDIIIPHFYESRRPDRVMLRGDEAVVVDYKFGLGRSDKYAVQVREYMQLMRRMGYRDVRGYLWYVASGDIEEVK